MVLRVLAPQPRPTAVPGTFFSLTAHAALLAAVVARGGPPGLGARPPGSADADAPDGERLHWVGVGGGSAGAGARAPRRNARPPLAFIIPGHGGFRVAAAERGAPGSAGDRGGRGRGGALDPTRGGGAPAGVRAANASAPSAAAVRYPESNARHAGARPAGARRPSLFRRVRSAATPDLAIPEAEMTRLVAGVLASAPDFARRAARAEEFVPTPAALVGRLTVQTGWANAFAADVHLRDVPIPLVSNRPPEYPDALARAGVGGRVVVEFLIDSTGEVDAGTLRVVESTDWRFTEAVRGSLPALHFTPALHGERPVGVTVRQPFVFAVRPAG